METLQKKGHVNSCPTFGDVLYLARVAFINWLFKGAKIMSTLSDVQAAVSGVNDDVAALSVKLDAIVTLITDLKTQSGPVTQDQLDQLYSQIQDLKSSSASDLQKATDIAG